MSGLRVLLLLGAVGLPSFMVSCGSSAPRGLPRKLPEIKLYGSPQTPSHSMAKHDYPFDSNGNYVVAWASQGESAASASDISIWQSSHGGSVSRKQPSPVKKVSSSSTKKKTASSKSKSSGGGGSYTIKKGDTLGAIASRNKTTVAKLKAANGMSSDFIREGKMLKIPK